MRENSKGLLSIPGVGKSIAKDLNRIGIHTLQDLENRDPEVLYRLSCEDAGQKIDRCLLYVYRCAVYFASTPKPDPEKLKWWKWKD